jgi:putative acetyltransferase
LHSTEFVIIVTFMISIRHQQQSDIEDIREVNSYAFEQLDEADLIDALRKSGKIVIELVAEEEDGIVGHIVFTPMCIDGSEVKIAGLAPMAVLPEYQSQGIGSLLMTEGLDECRSLGYDAVVVLGHPDYYPRFDFKPASEFGLSAPWDDIPDEAFMAIELHTGALEGVSGIARYAPEFDALI